MRRDKRIRFLLPLAGRRAKKEAAVKHHRRTGYLRISRFRAACQSEPLFHVLLIRSHVKYRLGDARLPVRTDWLLKVARGNLQGAILADEGDLGNLFSGASIKGLSVRGLEK